MTEFNSSLGRKQIPQSKQREFVVQDESEDLRKFEEEIRREKQARINPEKERMSDPAKKRIEFLLNLTTLKKEVTINNTKFVIRTLKSNELRDVLKAGSIYNDSPKFEFLFELRRNILARSLVSIESLDFDSFIGSDNLQDKIEFIDSMDENLLKLLHAAYEELFKESEDKYGIKTEEQQKELVEDLKK